METMTNAQKRAAARLNQDATVSGHKMAPMQPATIDLLALTGHMSILMEGYDPITQGLRPLWAVCWVHANIDEALTMAPSEINEASVRWGQTWGMETIGQATNWLAGQCDLLEKTMTIADPPKGQKGRRATRPTR